jgi:hypothetical protein
MFVESRLYTRIVIGMILIIFICSIPSIYADENDGSVVVNNSIDKNNSYTTSPSDTSLPDTSHVQDNVVSSKTPIITVKALSPSTERKISTNLLYIIDSNIPENAVTREQAADLLRANGQMKTIQPESVDSLQDEKTGTSISPVNLVFAYVDFIPSASTSEMDSYFQEVTDRNEQEHYVTGWVDVNTVDTIASLEIVTNVRPGEPSITPDSPVYQDTKFVNKRAGLPLETVEEAKESVRGFEKVPEIALEQSQSVSTSRGEIYEVTSDDGRYYVNAKTGEVELASYSYYSNFPVQNLKKSYAPLSGESKDGDPVAMDSALAFSQDFAAENYQTFYNRTLVLTRSQLIDHGDAGKTWFFIWNEKINDIVTPNGVSVSVNAYNGRILSYIGIDQPVDLDAIPSVSKESSIKKAIDKFSPIVITDTNAYLAVMPVDEKTQKLVWVVDVRGEPENSIERGGYAIIDAHSGEVLEVDSYA